MSSRLPRLAAPPAGRSKSREVVRGTRAERCARAGVQTRVLDGATATAVLAAAVDPYQYTDASWPRTPAHRPVTAPRFNTTPDNTTDNETAYDDLEPQP